MNNLNFITKHFSKISEDHNLLAQEENRFVEGGVAALLPDNVLGSLSVMQQNAVLTLLMHHEMRGEVNDAFGTFPSAKAADIAAHEFYNPLSQLIHDEIQWFVIYEDGEFKVTFGSVASLSAIHDDVQGKKDPALETILRHFDRDQVIYSGKTYCSHKSVFNEGDLKRLAFMRQFLNQKNYNISFSTPNGKYYTHGGVKTGSNLKVEHVH